jgi:hypothetical protein
MCYLHPRTIFKPKLRALIIMHILRNTCIFLFLCMSQPACWCSGNTPHRFREASVANPTRILGILGSSVRMPKTRTPISKHALFMVFVHYVSKSYNILSWKSLIKVLFDKHYHQRPVRNPVITLKKNLRNEIPNRTAGQSLHLLCAFGLCIS